MKKKRLCKIVFLAGGQTRCIMGDVQVVYEEQRTKRGTSDSWYLIAKRTKCSNAPHYYEVHKVRVIGSLTNDDGDGNENGK